MRLTFEKFLQEESGAVTVDWVVLTAGVAVLGLIVGTALTEPTESLAANIASNMATAAN
ncbi:hypothetical protein [Maritimibacter sp. 55A14]|uniref:hypothetical protein n=1 Tax=Maritimibacter sp. 55A14 TaxID=2174844 RepID=UPI0018EEB0BA|nr:hypothetical protein [Maritimibacter sp. 55A14]